jgi:hypothetical protein
MSGDPKTEKSFSKVLKFLSWNSKLLLQVKNLKKHRKKTLFHLWDPHLPGTGACTIKLFTAVIYGFS